MRKIALLLAVVMIFMVPVNALAAEQSDAVITPTLTISGRTATCEATVRANSPTDYIEMRVTVWYETRCLLDETVSGYGIIRYNDTVGANSGWYCTLRVDVTINGVAQPTVEDSAYCP